MHRSWTGLGRWADRRLPGLLLLAFLLLMSQLDSARATDIDLAPAAADEGPSLVLLGLVCAALLPALAALLYGLRQRRAGRPLDLPASNRRDPTPTTEHRTMTKRDSILAQGV